MMIESLSLGRFLKEKRKERNLGLEEISSRTKIPITLLKHLENEEWDKLPNFSYLKGHLKAYCKLTNISYEEVLEKYQKELLAPQKENTSEEINTHSISAKEELYSGPLSADSNLEKKNPFKVFSFFNGKLLLVGFILISFIFFFLLFQFLQKKTAVPKKILENTLPSVSIQEKVAIKESTVTITPSPSSALTPSITSTAIDASPATSSLETTEKKITEEQIIPKLPSLTANQQTIHLAATIGDSWITYKAGDRPIRQFLLEKGKEVTITGELIRLVIGDISSLKIFHQNKEFTTRQIGSSKSRSLVFPTEKTSKYPLPLFKTLENGTVETTTP